MKHIEINTPEEALELLKSKKHIKGYAFQSIDFSPFKAEAAGCTFQNCLFLGGHLPLDMQRAVETENLVFPNIQVPFNPFIGHLYDASTLYAHYVPGQPETFKQTFDQIVYRHYLTLGKEMSSAIDIKETLARTLHDHSISNALHEFLSQYDERSIVGIMGGHGLKRTDTCYRQIVNLSKQLTEEGFLMISGGGPGAMEATHLGAWMAGKTEAELTTALEILEQAPTFDHPLWLDTAFEVMQRFSQTQYRSLGVPTWLYGHEPATPFATHIAKYFDNSIREDGILTIAKGGIVYTPGSAGTMQEIFQDATQNHYESFGYASPMIFMGEEFWTQEIPVYPLLSSLMKRGRYRNLLLTLTDKQEEMVSVLKAFRNASPQES